METVQREVLSSGVSSNVRIVTKVEGEEEHRIFDFAGQEVIGVVLSHDEEATTAQTIVVGATPPGMLKALDTLILALDEELIKEGGYTIIRAGLGMMLAAHAHRIAEEL